MGKFESDEKSFTRNPLFYLSKYSDISSHRRKPILKNMTLQLDPVPSKFQKTKIQCLRIFYYLCSNSIFLAFSFMEKEINTNVKLIYIPNRLSAEPGNFNFVAEVKRNKIIFRLNIREILLSTYKFCFPRLEVY